jgi:hypothetical protein
MAQDLIGIGKADSRSQSDGPRASLDLRAIMGARSPGRPYARHGLHAPLQAAVVGGAAAVESNRD